MMARNGVVYAVLRMPWMECTVLLSYILFVEMEETTIRIGERTHPLLIESPRPDDSTTSVILTLHYGTRETPISNIQLSDSPQHFHHYLSIPALPSRTKRLGNPCIYNPNIPIISEEKCSAPPDNKRISRGPSLPI